MDKSPRNNQSVATQEKEARSKKKDEAGRKPRGRVFIDEERCKGCGFCVAFCPRHVLEMSERFNAKGYHPPEPKRPEDCRGCDLCGHYCPDFAIFGVRINNRAKNKKEKKP